MRGLTAQTGATVLGAAPPSATYCLRSLAEVTFLPLRSNLQNEGNACPRFPRGLK